MLANQYNRFDCFLSYCYYTNKNLTYDLYSTDYNSKNLRKMNRLYDWPQYLRHLNKLSYFCFYLEHSDVKPHDFHMNFMFLLRENQFLFPQYIPDIEKSIKCRNSVFWYIIQLFIWFLTNIRLGTNSIQCLSHNYLIKKQFFIFIKIENQSKTKIVLYLHVFFDMCLSLIDILVQRCADVYKLYARVNKWYYI